MLKFPLFLVPTITLTSAVMAADNDTDSLSPERLTSIAQVYDRATSDPVLHVDALRPQQMIKILAAYETLDEAPLVDALPIKQWAVLRAAYRSHDTARGTKQVFVGN